MVQESARRQRKRDRTETMSLYQYIPHPRLAHLREEGPIKVVDQLSELKGFGRFNTWLAVKITAIVGTMICAYLFTALAFVSFKSAVTSGSLIVIVAWIAQTFLQLVLLPIIIVGQNVQAMAADKRAEQTYKDAEAVLREAREIQAHLLAQDAALSVLADKLGAQLPHLPAQSDSGEAR
jgi:hypothetical protein